jgi:hypothetical protein
MATCLRCNNGETIVLGALYSGMRTSFRPQESKFLTLETGDVMTKAMMCRVCGGGGDYRRRKQLRRLTSDPGPETQKFAAEK